MDGTKLTATFQAKFWLRSFNDCIILRSYLMFNVIYFNFLYSREQGKSH